MNTTFREATPEEVIANKALNIAQKRLVRFRHFVRENHCPQARNGVSHRQYSNGSPDRKERRSDGPAPGPAPGGDGFGCDAR